MNLITVGISHPVFNLHPLILIFSVVLQLFSKVILKVVIFHCQLMILVHRMIGRALGGIVALQFTQVTNPFVDLMYKYVSSAVNNGLDLPPSL